MRGLVSTAFLVMIVTPAWSYNNGNSYADRLERPMRPVGSKYTCKTSDCGELAVDQSKVLTGKDYENDRTVLVSRGVVSHLTTREVEERSSSNLGKMTRLQSSPTKASPTYVMVVPEKPIEPVVTWSQE